MTKSSKIPSPRHISRLFTDRKLATKIAIGFACLLVVMGALSMVSNLAFNRVEYSFENFNQRVAVAELAREVDRGFLAFRHNVREFAISGTDADHAAADKSRSVLREVLGKALAEIKDGERASKIGHLAEQFASYSNDFDKMAGLRKDQEKLVHEALDPTDVKLHGEIEELQGWAVRRAFDPNTLTVAGETFKQLMLVRRNINKTITRYDQAAAAATENAFTDLKKTMKRFGLALADTEVSDLFDTFNADLRRYADAYGKAASDASEIETLMKGEMAAMEQAIATDADEVKQSGIVEQKQIEEDTAAQISNAERLILMLSIGGVALGLVLAWLIGRSISAPTRAIGSVLIELSNGNKQVEVPYANRGDEVGDNARAALAFRENLVRIERMEAEQKEAEVRAAARRKSDTIKLADEFQATVGQIVDTVSSASTKLEAAAGTLTRTADQTQNLSASVASASEQASANVHSVASATEEMTFSVNEISRHVEESARIASAAVRQAEATDARINQLSQAAGRIGDVVKLITAIAEQTNLLALNATIEAARAGDAGKGFAVVASEVKQLALQTAKATGEIANHIAGMQSATQDSVAAITEIGTTIGQLSSIASTIAAAVKEQGASTQEIARNVGEAAKGTSQVATDITDVSRGANETGSASGEVLASAKALASESSRLKLEVDRFLNMVRAA
jgi:methyl-accepting chemotaxis protein